MELETPEDIAVGYIHVVSQLMGGRFERKTVSISRGEFGLMMHLLDCGGKTSPGELAQAFHISSGGVSNLLRSLLAKRYVERRRSASDGRCAVIELTPEGRAALEERIGQVKRTALRYVEAMGTRDSAELVRLLNRVREASEGIEIGD